MLGKAGYGAYAYAIAWLGVLSFPLGHGLDQLLVRNTAARRATGARDLIRGLLCRSTQIVLSVSMVLSALSLGLVWLFARPADPVMRSALQIALLMLPVIGLLRICESSMRGLQEIPRAYLPEMLFRPMTFFALALGAFWGGRAFSPEWAVGINGIAAAGALLIGLILLRISVPVAAREQPARFATAEWLRSAWPLWLISLMIVVNVQADVIMLGSLRGKAETGLYAVAARGAQLISFILIAVNAVLGPAVAGLHASGDLARLQRVITRSARAVLGLTVPVAVALILFGDWFLLLFGRSFTEGHTALVILCVGQIVNSGMGSVGLILIMTGHDWDALGGLAFGAALNILLNALLIPRWGLQGAAVATASSMIAWNLILVVRVRRRLRLDSTALGLRPRA